MYLGIIIDFISIPTRQAFCVQDKCLSFIAIDRSKLNSEREEKQTVAEELCHCKYGYTYKLKDYANPLYKQNVSKCESLARRAAIKKIVPLDELKRQLKNNTCYEEIAENLNVLPRDIAEAIRIYQIENKLDAYIFLEE